MKICCRAFESSHTCKASRMEICCRAFESSHMQGIAYDDMAYDLS